MSCTRMRSIPLAEILRMSIQSPNAEAVARTLGISRRMLYDCWPSASLEEVRHALVQHVTDYETPPTEERQARLEGAQRDELLYLQVQVLPAQFPVWRRSHIRQSLG
jgi:hypothetical protein